jgi:hypothetical protein
VLYDQHRLDARTICLDCPRVSGYGAVTQANIQSTICSYRYTDTVRPPESVSEPEKEASLAAYGDSGPLDDYEYDHFLSGRRRVGAPVLPACSLVVMSAREGG